MNISHFATEPFDTEIEWDRVRSAFAATQTTAYLKTAATGLPVPHIAATIAAFYDQLNAGGDAAWEQWAHGRETARARLAAFINAEPDEVAFAPNTSFGMNLIIDALEGAGSVVTSSLEFPTSTITWLHRGFELKFIEPHHGAISVEHIEDAMTDKSGVICLSHVQFSNGFRADLEAIGACKKHYAFVVNASQSAGVFEIDVKKMKIDALCATGHKWLLAGFGAGFVYMSRELQARRPPRIIGWQSTPDPFAFRNRDYEIVNSMAARAEMGTPALPPMLALGTSLEYLMQLGIRRIERRALELNAYLTRRLAQEGFCIVSPLHTEAMRSAETLVALAHPASTVEHLSKHNVQVSLKPEGIRISTHFYNTEEDVEQLIAGLKTV